MWSQEAEQRPVGGSDRKQIFNSKKRCNIWSCPAVEAPASRRRSPNRQAEENTVGRVTREPFLPVKSWLGELEDPFQTLEG